MKFFSASSLSNLLMIFSSTVISVLAIIVTARFIGPLPISVNQTLSEKKTTFTSTGTAELDAEPDEAQVSVGITVQRPTVGEAQNEANSVQNKLIDSLAGLGIDKDDISTQNYSINPNYNYNDGQNSIDGYNINATLRVSVTDFELLNKVIDTATSQGANQVGGISFGISKEKRETLTKEARKLAIKDAKESAEELADLSGVKLGRVVDAQEGGGSYPQPLRYETFSAAADLSKASEPTQIQPGTQTFNYSVTLSFETL